MAKLRVEVVTVERVVYEEDDVDMVIAPGVDGSLGILPRHAALVSTLALGEMRIRKGGNEESLVVFGGFIEVAHNQVRVLADTAERAEDIDVARAQAARDRAEARLAERTATIDFTRAEIALRRSMIRLRVGQRSRGRQPSSPRVGE